MAHTLEPHIWVRDFWPMVAWYRQALGFLPAQWYPDEETATWVQLKHGDVSVMLARVPAEIAPNQQYMTGVPQRLDGPGGALSLYLHVEDADAAYQQAAEAGAEPIEDIWDAWWGGRQFTLADPEGNWWTVYAPADS